MDLFFTVTEKMGCINNNRGTEWIDLDNNEFKINIWGSSIKPFDRLGFSTARNQIALLSCTLLSDSPNSPNHSEALEQLKEYEYDKYKVLFVDFHSTLNENSHHVLNDTVDLLLNISDLLFKVLDDKNLAVDDRIIIYLSFSPQDFKVLYNIKFSLSPEFRFLEDKCSIIIII